MGNSDESKVVLVTGSSSGIGAATVKLFAQKGYNVVVCGYEPELVEQVAEECIKTSPKSSKPLRLTVDLSVADNCKMVVEKTIEHFGRLDVLVNSAGIFMKSDGQDPASVDVYRQLMTVNTDATVRVSLAAVEHLKVTRGSIIFVSSVLSIRHIALGYAYCMTKAALTSFAKCLAIDVSPHVRVNIVSPGPVLTSLYEKLGLTPEVVSTLLASTTLQQRVGTANEIAETIYFLASTNSSFIHGHDLVIDGGYLLTQSVDTQTASIVGHKNDV